MPDVAAIDGITGPGRRTTMIQGDVNELTFKFKKKIIEVTNKDGSLGQYDLAQVSGIQVKSDGADYVLTVVSRKEETDDDRIKQSEWRNEALDLWTDTIADKSTRIGSVTAPTIKSDAGKITIGDFDKPDANKSDSTKPASTQAHATPGGAAGKGPEEPRRK